MLDFVLTPRQCHPNHHNMTWEDALRKFAVSSPDLPPAGTGGPLSQSPNGTIYHEPQSQEMDIDSGPPAVQPLSRPVSSDANARIRTPLPSAPSARQPLPTGTAHYANNHPPLPPPAGLGHSDLQAAANRIFSSQNRSRYAAVQVMILYWQDDEDKAIKDAINDLAGVLDKAYKYTFELSPIPMATETCKSPWRWLSRKVNDFIENRDHRDVLKIVFYVGDTFLDSNREMVLSR